MLWESIGPIKLTFGEFIIQRVKKGKTQCPSNPALQPQGAACNFPKCKGKSLLCTFVYAIPCPLLVPFHDTTEASLILSRLSYTHIYFSFLFVSSRFYVDFYHRRCNFAAYNGLRVCLPYQILSSLSGGMYYSYLSMSKAQHSVRLISDVQELFRERWRKEEIRKGARERGREEGRQCMGPISIQHLVCASHLRAHVFFNFRIEVFFKRLFHFSFLFA